MIKLLSDNTKVCAMCRYWNGGRGCPSFRVKGPHFYEVDNKEVQQCYKTGFKKGAFGFCSDFQKNY